METYQKVLLVDCETSFYKIFRFKVGDFFSPVDLGLYLTGRYNSLNIVRDFWLDLFSQAQID